MYKSSLSDPPIPAARYDGLRRRVGLVTGAGGGLGSSLARAFALQGASVALSGVRDEELEPLVSALGGAAKVGRFPADLGEASACGQLISDVTAEFGRIDVLINNAAMLSTQSLENVTVEEFDRILAVNLRAPFLLTQAALAAMRTRGSGRIVNVASMAARTGGAGDAFAYAASKGGLVALTKAIARVAAADGVLVNAILPANIDTKMLPTGSATPEAEERINQIPLRRLASPAEVAELVVWLSSDACSYVTGAAYEIAGGWWM